MREETIYSHVAETGENTYAVDIEVSGHHIKGDEPIVFGGGNTGPTPYDLLLAALGECSAMTVRWYARQKNWPLTKVEVALSYQKKDKVDHFEKKIVVHGDRLTPEQKAKLVEIAAKCPVQRTLESGAVIDTVAG